MKNNPRDYPDEMTSAESGRPMVRGDKPMTIVVDGRKFTYNQPGWWCSLTDPNDTEGELVDGDNQVRDMVRRTAKAIVAGETLFVPVVIRAIREQCGLSQVEADQVFGGGDTSFEKYERGEVQPSNIIKRLLKLAMEHPEHFRRSGLEEAAPPTSNDAALVRRTLKATAMDRIYAPLFARWGDARQEPV